MTTTRMKLVALTALLSVAGAVLGSNGENETLKDIAGYRQWTRLTDRPIIIPNSFAEGG